MHPYTRRYVTPEELRAMMDPSSGLLWSPWFRVIADTWLFDWWADLDEVRTRTECMSWEGVERGGGGDCV